MSVELQTKLPPPSPAVVEAIRVGRELPLLDIGPFLAGAPGAMEQLAADVRNIQESLGFYAIVNHGIDQALIAAAHAEAAKLFALPEEVRMKSRAKHHMQGYWPANATANIRPGFENEKEKSSSMGGWTFLRDRAEDDPKVLAGLQHRTTNKWPDPALVPDFRPTVQRYHAELLRLAYRLVPVYAVALGLAPDYFDRDFSDAEWYSRCNHYEAREHAEDEIAATAHTDHSFLTLLPMSPVPGLQLRTPAKTWMDVPYVPEAIIVNTGEWLNRLSNGRFVATPHRVTQPASERITMPLFMDPNDEAMDTPVPGAVKPGEARKFPPTDWHTFFSGYVGAYTKQK